MPRKLIGRRKSAGDVIIVTLRDGDTWEVTGEFVTIFNDKGNSAFRIYSDVVRIVEVEVDEEPVSV
jgi:hypothetical protein